MSQSTDFLTLVLSKALDWGIPFVLGLLFRKQIGRLLIRLKKFVLNDFVDIDFLAIRLYSPSTTTDISHDIFDDIRNKIPGVKLSTIFAEGLKISIPVFGNLKITMEKVTDEEEPNYGDVEGVVESIKITLKPESPVRLGTREINKLDDLSQISEGIFGAFEKCCISKSKIIESYILVEVPRIQHFKEEKSFKLKDAQLGASVNATPEKLSIVVSPMTYVSKSVKKYMLI